MIAPREEVLEGWGMSVRARSWVYRPRDAAEAAEAAQDARRRGLTIAHRGAGQSYGDAALNEGGAVLECSGIGRILAVDRETGTVRAEAGVTIAQLWKHVLPAGFWPSVVPGTMAVTLGGATAMNIHGKNAFRVGPFGEHVEAITLLGPDGAVRKLRRDRGAGDLRLSDVIGAQGLNMGLRDAADIADIVGRAMAAGEDPGADGAPAGAAGQGARAAGVGVARASQVG